MNGMKKKSTYVQLEYIKLERIEDTQNSKRQYFIIF